MTSFKNVLQDLMQSHANLSANVLDQSYLQTFLSVYESLAWWDTAISEW